MDIDMVASIQATLRTYLVKEKLLDVKKEFLEVALSCEDNLTRAAEFADACLQIGTRDQNISYDNALSSNESSLIELLEDMSVGELTFLKSNLVLELLWLDQAVTSRETFISYKSKTCN